VVDFLKARPEPVSDGELEKRVVQRLEQDALANRPDIAVEVDDGWVALTGDVATSYEKSQAELAVHAVKGVQGVVNRIGYDRIWYWMPDPDLREAVREQLSWSVFTDYW